MIENVLSDIGGVGMYGVISICIFFVFFVGVIVWMLRLKKPYLKSMSTMPLEDDSACATRLEKNINPEQHHE